MLFATANQIAGARDLPMGPHDIKVMSGPQVLEAFKKSLRVKQELFAPRYHTAERDHSLLAELRARCGRG